MQRKFYPNFLRVIRLINRQKRKNPLASFHLDREHSYRGNFFHLRDPLQSPRFFS